MGKKRMVIFSIFWGLMLISSQATAWPVPDTGQTGCYDAAGTSITCPETGRPFAGQDGNYSINPPSYTTLDESGNALPDSATSWVMVRDNVTGLTWEVKTNMDSVRDYTNHHDADNIYSWYDPNPETNGGYSGSPEDGTGTKGCIDAINEANFGGYSDWRVPTRKELRSIAIYGWRHPSINTNYFPNTKNNAYYWSFTTYVMKINYAGLISFTDGQDTWGPKILGFTTSKPGCVRAVRGGQ